MDIKLKNIKIKSYVIYLLILILSSTIILSFLEVKNNLIYLIPSSIYSKTELSGTIYDYINLAMDYSLYYKSEEYVKNKDNITTNDIEICKAEIRDQIDQEYEEFRYSKYNNDTSFNNLSYEEQEKILNEERDKIEEKYTLSDDKLNDYILERKINSFNILSNKLKSYLNLQFSAYDKLNNMWIGEEQRDITSLKKSSRYLREINIDFNGNVIEKIFINGKEVNENSSINKYINGKYNYYDHVYAVTESIGYENYNMDNHNIILYTWMPEDIIPGDIVYESLQSVQENVNKIAVSASIMAISIILVIVLIKAIKDKKELRIDEDRLINKLKDYPIEFKIAPLIILYIFWRINIYNVYYIGYMKVLKVNSVICLSIILAIMYLLIKILIINYKEGTLFSNNITIGIYKGLSKIATKGSIINSIFIIIMSYIVVGGLLLAIAIAIPEIFIICLLIGLIITAMLIILVVRKLLYLDKIMIGAKDGARGQLNYKIDVKGEGHLGELANNINNIKEGLRKSVENEMKSENMKTELITNVSHDLKTPLTSIINYIDLLKRENIEPESARDYVNILDKKSQRLKVLIEDLFEASKAASGAMELNISKLDIGQLLRQALGENDERFNEKQLEVKLNIPDEKIFINGDGKRLYRVFENLISNAVKYSLSNTRVYIDMSKNEENEVTIVMKNISAYELNFDVNEITNRFKRGDSSRSTDGSGLGLAIAKSIVELHGGKFNIEIDGDLFKSIIVLK
ncbi:HAMP domain-containing sensor histidine kinase [Clostridium celatum]|nr:HAMP domain-containing sensor histidine kinase [Clostridium celatum]MCE9655001.1 HAMP domain-containing histidine kinase [Clostridium celatum]MDU2266062.1 HAMP domain-containing sensor histidine kinase [Clostridium celatum]MDU6296366.1 HAMP domain-containing sensor histidine kinase [Clostridium celatum]MDY3362042.1 HAMP domain-containing sensor histidine kinase [Clostridium celatum]